MNFVQLRINPALNHPVSLTPQALASLNQLSAEEKKDHFFVLKALLQTQLAQRQAYVSYISASRQSLETSLALVRSYDRETRRQLHELVFVREFGGK